jgi:hypothetical protein
METDMGLCRLIYQSHANTRALSPKSLAGLLDQCVLNNDVNGVTGLLLVTETQFLQVLEGESAKVNELFQRISRDKRHSEVRLVSFEPIHVRRFDSWTMRLVDLRDAPDDCKRLLAEKYAHDGDKLVIPEDPLDVHALLTDAKHFCLAPDE